MGKGRVERIRGGALDRARRWTGADVGERELKILVGIIVLGFAIRVAYVLITRGYDLAGDQVEYNSIGLAATDGKWFHTTFPYNELHESVARPPGYMLWIGFIYTFVGATVTKATMVQTLLGPIVIVLVWLLARRLFNARVAFVAAAIAAIYPNMWQWEGRLYSEALALPLGALLLVLVIERPPTRRLAIWTGVVLAAAILVRPTSAFFIPLVLAAFWTTAGAREAFVKTAVALGVAILCIAPWSIRNYAVADAFIPLSLQDIAVAGTFNPDSANDDKYPYAWRPFTERDKDIFGPQATNKLSDADLHEEMIDRAKEFIKDNPESVPKAFFWNGLVRTWDIRSPERILDEVAFEGRERGVAKVGMWAYWLLLALALAAVWRLRARKSLWVPFAAGAAAASVVFTVAAATRYRVPFEPVFVVLASTTIVALWERFRGSAEPPPETAAAA